MKSLLHIFVFLVVLCGISLRMSAQTIKNSSYQTVAHIKSDGTVQDSNYRAIGHANGVPLKWAAFYFFFRKFNT